MGVRGRDRPGLGRNFTKLWVASAFSNVADGIYLTAGPLLVSSLTSDATLVGAAVFVQYLPWLLFALVSGAYVDRLDRRRLVVAVNVGRALVAAGLALAVIADVVSVPLVYAAFFLMGTAETLADNASSALIPMLVRPDDLPRANARLIALQTTVNQFAGPPLGSALFAATAALPFGANAAAFLLTVPVLATVDAAVPERAERRPLWTEIREGLGWLWRHPVVRMLAFAICLMNVTMLAGFGILVLYAREHLGLGEVGYGVLVAAMAVGGLLGAAVAGRLRAWLRDSVLLRAGLVVETLTHVLLALADTAWFAGVVLAVFGAHGAMWGVVSQTWRQRVVPDELRGRVNSVHLLFSVGGAAVGSLAGGAIASGYGLTAPFWCSAVAMTVVTAVAWRSFGRRLVDRPG